MATDEPANHRDRIAATGIDLLLVLLAGALTLTVTGGVDPTPRLALVLLAVGVPTLVVEGVVGRSPGKLGVALRHAPEEHAGHDLTIGQVAGRYVLKWLVPVVLVALGLWIAAVAWWLALYVPALGPAHRTAHDRLTRSRVLGPTEQDRAHGRAQDY